MNSDSHPRSGSRWPAGVARGMALFVGLFAGLSLLGIWLYYLRALVV